MSLESIRQDITLLGEAERLEWFQGYWKRRALDMLKPSTYNPGVKKKKAKAKTKAKAKVKKGKEVTATKLKKLPPDILALLRQAGLEV